MDILVKLYFNVDDDNDDDDVDDEYLNIVLFPGYFKHNLIIFKLTDNKVWYVEHVVCKNTSSRFPDSRVFGDNGITVKNIYFPLISLALHVDMDWKVSSLGGRAVY